MNRNALAFATLAGLVLQVAMVAAGHYSPAVAGLFAVGGMGLSLIAGLIYAAKAKSSWRDSAIGGAIAGGLCAFVGIAVSFALGDVPASLLALGAVSSILTGAIGGLAGRAVFRR